MLWGTTPQRYRFSSMRSPASDALPLQVRMFQVRFRKQQLVLKIRAVWKSL